MDFDLTEEQRMTRDAVRKFAEKEVKPAAMEYDRKPDPRECIPLDLYAKGFEQGYHQMIIPAEFGGAGLDAVTTLVILEELAAADAGYATTWHVNNIALTTLLNLGGEEQIRRFVKPILEGRGGVSALSTTEPDGGVTSALLIDPANFVFKTTARLYQLIQAKIADMYIGLEAARSLAYRAASYSDAHPVMDLKLARAAKVFASETANRVVYDALQVLGGIGYCKGTLAEKCTRDQRVTTIYEGTNEPQRISISRLIEAGM